MARNHNVFGIGRSRLLLLALIVLGVLLAVISSVRFQAPELLGQKKVLTDFDAFHLAGRLALEGRVSEAYHALSMFAAQMEIAGTAAFMPWTYPPPFTLAMQGLAGLPIGAAFLVFALGSFAFYIWVLRRIAGPWLPGVVMAVAPAILLNLRTGQNGFLIAGLIGAFLLAFRDNRRVAGVPLGLLIIKPHLAVAVGLIVLRPWWTGWPARWRGGRWSGSDKKPCRPASPEKPPVNPLGRSAQIRSFHRNDARPEICR